MSTNQEKQLKNTSCSVCIVFGAPNILFSVLGYRIRVSYIWLHVRNAYIYIYLHCIYIYRAIKMATLENTVLERLKSSLLLFRHLSFERNLIISTC